MNKVYGLMSVAMLITGGRGLGGWHQRGDDRRPSSRTPLKWVVMFAPLIMVFAFGALINRLSVAAAQLFFYVYAALMGLSIRSSSPSTPASSIAQTFLVTAIAFAGLSLYGYTTKSDLSAHGHLPDDGSDRA